MVPIKYQVVGEEDYAFVVEIAWQVQWMIRPDELL
jgi:hypothetical protein